MGTVPHDVSDKVADLATPWSAPTLAQFTDRSWEQLSAAERRHIAGHFAWAAHMPPDTFGDLKLPHHRARDGAVVWRGVANAASRLNQADIPAGDRQKVQAHLGAHYRDLQRQYPDDDWTPPWEEKAGGLDLGAVRQEVARAIVALGNQVLVCQGVGESFTHLPGGHVEAGETPAGALARELREELGRDVSNLYPVATFANTYDDRQGQHVEETNHVFAVRLYAMHGEMPGEAKEGHLRLRWVNAHELEGANLMPPAMVAHVQRVVGSGPGLAAGIAVLLEGWR